MCYKSVITAFEAAQTNKSYYHELLVCSWSTNLPESLLEDNGLFRYGLRGLCDTPLQISFSFFSPLQLEQSFLCKTKGCRSQLWSEALRWGGNFFIC